jgi:SNF2 family DNA or RNA helicase
VPGSDGYSQIEPMPFAQEQIQAAIKDICLTIDIRDYYDIGEPVDIDVVVDMPPKAKQIYKDMEKKMFATLASGYEKEAFSAAAKSMSCAQIASGACYVGEDDGSDTRPWEEVHDQKIQALASIIAEAAGNAMLIVYFFKSDLARLKKAFPKGRHFDKKISTKQDFLDGKFTEMFIHAQSGGHGVDGLQKVCHIIVFFSQDWNLDYYQQVTERVGPARQFQIGSKENVLRYHIISKDTIDEVVMARRKSKASVQDALLEYLKNKEAQP